MDVSVYEFEDYRKYLASVLPIKGEKRGARSALSEALGFKPAFLSRVLSGQADLSLEHAMRASEFFKHTEEESHFFLLLVHRGRAGSKILEQYYSKQIKAILKAREQIAARLGVQENLTLKEQTQYYSSWLISTIHMALLRPERQDPGSLARALRAPEAAVRGAIDFLLNTGLIVQEGTKIKPGKKRIHVPSGSPLVNQHHLNWRLCAMERIPYAKSSDVHFSGALCLSRKDYLVLRKMVLEFLDRFEQVVGPSKEEVVGGLNVDLFQFGEE